MSVGGNHFRVGKALILAGADVNAKDKKMVSDIICKFVIKVLDDTVIGY